MLFSTTTVVTLLLALSNVAEAKTSAVKTTAVKTSTSTSTKPTSTKVGKAPMVDGNKYIFRVDTANDLAKPGKITPKYLSSLSKTGLFTGVVQHFAGNYSINPSAAKTKAGLTLYNIVADPETATNSILFLASCDKKTLSASNPATKSNKYHRQTLANKCDGGTSATFVHGANNSVQAVRANAAGNETPLLFCYSGAPSSNDESGNVILVAASSAKKICGNQLLTVTALLVGRDD